MTALRVGFIALLLGLWTVAGAWAQEQASPDTRLTDEDYATWARTAKRAEDVLAARRASSLSLEQLRSVLAEWRARFLEGQNVNEDRIATVQEQLNTLGAPPEEGVKEPDEIAIRREALTNKLAELRVPQRQSEESYTLADGLIRQVDRLIRERQADALLELGDSPLLPVTWAGPLQQMWQVIGEVSGELSAATDSANQRAALRGNLPKVLGLLVLGIVLIVRGKAWSDRAARFLLQRTRRRTQKVTLSLLVSIGQVVLPFLGVLALIEAAYATGFIGLLGSAILSELPTMAALFLVSIWLAGRCFPIDPEDQGLLSLTPERRRVGRYSAALLGGVLAVWALFQQLLSFNRLEDAALSVLSFPLVLVTGLGLYWLSQLILAHVRSRVDAPEDTRFSDKVLRLVAQVGRLLAIAGPVLAAVGYARAGIYFTVAPVMSLGLLAFVGVLQRFATQIYLVFFGSEDGEEAEGLIPVLMSFLLMIAALPVFALIWGARVADLTELWARFLSGVTIGDTVISPSNFLTFAGVFVLLYMLTRLVQGALRSSVLPKTNIDPGGQNAIVSGTGYLGIFLAAVVAISTAGIDLSGVAIVAGALSVGIGFGLQTIVSNFVSGIILLIERPVSEGDWVEVAGVHGTVRKIAVRATTIETFDRSEIIVPNSDLISGQVTNYTKTNLTGRLIVHVGVAYGSDTERVAAILREVAEAHPLVILRPPPMVIFAAFGASSLDFEVRVILRDVNFILSVKNELHHAIAKRFAEENIEIPFPQQDLWLRNPERLPGATPGEGGA